MAQCTRFPLFRCCKLLKASSGRITAVRNLNLQEFQSKRLLAKYGVTTEKFDVATSPEDAVSVAKSLGVPKYVVKAQILAGGKGKGVFTNGFKGGVHLVNSPDQAGSISGKMLDNNLITKQTTADGVTVKTVSINEAVDIGRETYFAILLDREHYGPVMVASPMGGVNIEEVAKTQPEAIFSEPIDISTGVSEDQALRMASNLGFTGDCQRQAADNIRKLYVAFEKLDATQIEINPFGETKDGRALVLDAKIKIDDNAAFRQHLLFSLKDDSDVDPREIEANKHDLNYIGLDGSIACLVNGAGLAMATMDIIKLHGGEPANFLDVGGAVTEKQVEAAFKLLTSDSQVKAILVNIFGGIVNCATIATGIINACKMVNVRVPLIVRLEGTNVDAAKTLLADSHLPVDTATDLTDAAQKAVGALGA